MLKRKQLHRLNSRGETILETLAALLVVTLSTAVFMSMVTAALRISSNASRQDNAFYAQVQAAEAMSGTSTEITVTIDGIKADYTYQAQCYGEDDAIKAYTGGKME